MITSLKIILDFGHDGAGNYNLGLASGPYSQLAVTDLYASYFCDSLDHYGIRYSVVDTRRAPGLTAEDRLKSIGVGELGLVLSTGWHERPKQRIGSQVSFYGKDGLKIAEELLDALFEWGTCTCFGHVRNYPREEVLFKDLASLCIKIEPFPLNALLYRDYLQRLKPLGFELGRFFYEWITGYSPAILNRPQGIRDRAKAF